MAFGGFGSLPADHNPNYSPAAIGGEAELETIENQDSEGPESAKSRPFKKLRISQGSAEPPVTRQLSKSGNTMLSSDVEQAWW